jgi:RNA polymerase sigma factor (TIGR02999 family)
MPQNPEQQITRLLYAAGDGDSRAAAELLPLVYERLRALAASQLRRIPPGQTLQPTALVHEAYLKVVGDEDPGWESRRHFFSAAARAMHNILVDQARRKASIKHGGAHSRVSADNLADAIAAPAEDMLALSDTLDKLEQENNRQHQIVMLRFFGGLTVSEAADIAGVDERTARRDWLAARLFLLRHLREGAPPMCLEQEDA